MRRPGKSARRLGAALVTAVGLLAPGARAEEPRVACTATRVGRRVLVRPEASALLAPELERLMKLGLAGRLELELTLRRRRSLWFSTRVDGARLTQVLSYAAKEGGWMLDGREVEPGTLELERVAWALEEELEQTATLEVEVRVRLQVVTADSLGKVAEWLTQGEATDTERSALTRNLLRTVAEDLTRGAEGRCTVRTAQGEQAL
jgi:hypothetical protein